MNDYFGQLTSQFPISRLRVVYSKAGTIPAATIVRDERAIIENTLYWYSPKSEGEAYYLCAILNSETTRVRGEDYQSRGQWGARHFDKVAFNLPIPVFDNKKELHCQLAVIAEEAEGIAAKVELPDGVKFQRARRLVREALAEAGTSQCIDALVTRLLDGNID